MTVRLLLFATAREAAGRAHDEFDVEAVPTVAALVDAAGRRYGAAFVALLPTARVWVNGEEPADGAGTALREGDEVAVLPPVSGG